MAAFVTTAAGHELQAAFAARLTAAAGRRSRQFRSVPVENLHLTLKFLGETTPERAAEALQYVAELDGRALAAQVLRFGGLPRPAAARVAAAELAPLEPLRDWWAALERRLGREGRAFRPHVTLARSRLPVRFAPQALEPPLALELAPPALYRSDPAEHGVRYRRVSQADLSDPCRP